MKKIIASPLLSFALLSYSLIANADFEVEPNNSSSTANILPINEVLTGSFIKGFCTNNYEYFRFSLPEARPDVTFHFRNITDNSKIVYLYLYDSAMKSIAIPVKSVNPYTTTSVDFKQNLAAGTYFIKLSSCTPTTDSDYELSVLTTPSVTPSIVGSVGMPDLNKNGKKDIAILRIWADASGVVEIRDGGTGEVINSINLPEGQALKPISITGFNDNNIGVISYDGVTKINAQYIFNAQTGEQITSFPIE